MNTMWEKLNEIDRTTFKFEGVASVLKLMAENISDSDTSGALWLCADVLEEKADDISRMVSEAMTVNRGMQSDYQELAKKVIKPKRKKK